MMTVGVAVLMTTCLYRSVTSLPRNVPVKMLLLITPGTWPNIKCSRGKKYILPIKKLISDKNILECHLFIGSCGQFDEILKKCWYCIIWYLLVGCWVCMNNLCRACALWMDYVCNKKTDWNPRITNSPAKCLIQYPGLTPRTLQRKGDIQTHFCSTTKQSPPLFL